ncbi:MAG: cysteine--tRNA ligase [Symbiobacteriaceae bacterium]|nr:cysteine--tRNA ligase [Symbiobacteriaceae bacterium]
MSLRIYNTLTRQKELFSPLDGTTARIYTCGLTVQDYSHIGHARMEVIWACFKNWLQASGYQVYHVANFTDLNEKIAARALEAEEPPLDYALRYINAYLEDMASLGLPPPNRYVRVSQELPSIISLIQELIAKGAAYEAQGNVYFRVSSYPAYGRLSGRRSEDAQSGGRIVSAGDKESPEDFALWTVPQPGEPVWESPWGWGTPGWHIECSAMSMKYLGESYDFHGGGMDLLFPHHENELAQSSAAGSEYAHFWVHHGMVNGPDGQKMSKSLGNFSRVRDILQEFPAWAVRLFLLSTHYRSPITFTPQLVAQSRQAFGRLQRLYAHLGEVASHTPLASDAVDAFLQTGEESAVGAMNDDFNTAEVIATLFEVSRALNTALAEDRLTPATAQAGHSFFAKWCRILGVEEGLTAPPPSSGENPELAPHLRQLIQERQEARQQRDWAKADRLRQELEEHGVILVDTPQGVSWRWKV